MNFNVCTQKRIFFLRVCVLFFFLFSYSIPSLRAQNSEEELFLVAQKAFEDNFYDVAIRYINQFLEEFPQTEKRIQAQLLLGQCYFFKGQYLKAFEVFQKLLKFSDSKDATLFWLGETYLKGSDYIQADKHFRQVITIYPNSLYATQSYYSLGWALFEQRKFEEAQEIFFKLARLYPLHHLSEDALLKAAECSYELNDYETAIQYFKDYIFRYDQSTRHDQAYFYIAECYYYLEDYPNAVEYYQKAIDITYNNNIIVMSKVSQGWGYLKLKKFIQAQEAFQEAQKLSHKDDVLSSDIFLGQATLFAEMGKNNEAMLAYEKLIANFPNSPRIMEAYLGRANTRYALKDYAQAITDYQEILKKFKDTAQPNEIIEKSYFGLAWSYLKSGNIDQAIEIFQEVENTTRSDIVKISALSQIGDAYQDINELEKALEVYDKILREYPDSLYTDYIQYRQGVGLLKLKRIESAILSLQSLLTNFPNSQYQNDARYYLGFAYFEKEDWSGSKAELEKFLAQNPSASEFAAEAKYLLGLSLLNLNRFDEALQTFETVTENHSAEVVVSQNAHLGIAQTLYKLKRSKEANKKLIDIIRQYPDSEASEDALLYLAEYHLESSQMKKAIEYFQQLIEEFPKGKNIRTARYELGQVFETQGQFDLAVEQYKLIEKSSEDDIYIKARIAIADIFAREITPQEAVTQYQKIAQASPEFQRDAYLKIARIHRSHQHYTKEILAYQNALKAGVGRSQIKDAELQFYIGDAYESLNKLDDAIESYLKIPYLYTQDKPWIVKAYLRIARIFEDKEDWENARMIYNKILPYKTEENKYVEERLQWITDNVKSIRRRTL